MTAIYYSPAIALLFVLIAFSNAGCALWLLNTRYQRAALTYRIGVMTLAGGIALAGIGVMGLPERPVFLSEIIQQIGMSLMFGLLARDQKRLGGHGERRRHVH